MALSGLVSELKKNREGGIHFRTVDWYALKLLGLWF